MSIEDIIVVPDATTGRVGAVTWWRVAESTNFDKLRDAWVAADHDESELPSLPGDNASLNRALREIYRDKHTLVRVLPNSVYAVVQEDVEDAGQEEDPEYEVQFKVWIDFTEMELKFDREVDEDTADKVTQVFERVRRELTTNDMSSWFVKRAEKLRAIRLRDTGGIYFVPETTAKEWSAFADIIASVSASKIFEVPAMHSKRAVEAIMDAVITETQTEVQALSDLLDTKEFSARGLKGKAKLCDTLAEKLKGYEQLLGVRMGEMQAVIEEVDAKIADLMLATEED